MLKHLFTEAYMTFKLKRLGRFAAIFGREAAPLGQPGHMPRIIHIFWDQGFENAPPLVQRCVSSWHDQNPRWRLNLLSSTEAEVILPRSSLPAGCTVQAYADMLRLRLLRAQGGVWADATCYCSKSLDGWLPWMMAQSDFFAFARPAYDRPLANWFLASQPNGRIVTRFHNDATAYLMRLHAPPRAYVWPHYLFEANLWQSRSLRQAWKNVPSLSATPIHLAQNILIAGREPTLEEINVLSAVPLHKLTYKKGVTDEAVAVLLSSIARCNIPEGSMVFS
jgi:hypothetical protein